MPCFSLITKDNIIHQLTKDYGIIKINLKQGKSV